MRAFIVASAGVIIGFSIAMLMPEHVDHQSIIDAYNQGRRDALKLYPVSFELEETCLNLWANKLQ
jgi:hypothetical protein